MHTIYNKYPWIVVLTIIFLSTASIGAIYYSFSLGHKMTAQYSILVDATMEAKLEATTSYLLLKESMNGEGVTEPDAIGMHIEETRWYLTAILQGDSNEEGKFLAIDLDETHMRANVNKALVLLDDYQKTIQQRLSVNSEQRIVSNTDLSLNTMFKSQQGIDSDTDLNLDTIFNGLILTIDRVESELQAIIAEHLHQYILIRDLLVLTILGINLFLIFVYRVIVKVEKKRLLEYAQVENKKFELQQQLDNTVEKASEAIIWVDKSGEVLYANNAMAELLGYEIQELTGMNTLVFQIDNDEAFRFKQWKVLEDKEENYYKTVMQHKDGHELNISVHSHIIYNKSEPVKIAYLHDITEEEKHRQELEQLNHELVIAKKLIDKHIPMSQTDFDGTITYANDAMCTVTGYRQKELVGKKHSILKHPDQDVKQYDELWATIEQNKVWDGELLNCHKDGSDFWVKAYVQPLHDVDGVKVGYQALREDITNRKKLEVLASYDKLTGIYNRAKFDILIENELDRFRRYEDSFSLALFDLDHFKQVNDSYGHLVGDEVLVKCVEIIKESVRMSDILARWGGEEFVLLLPHTNVEKAVIVAEKIRQSIDKSTFETVGKMTISSGVVQVKTDEDLNVLFKRVDDALYQAKGNGRNCVVQF